MSKREELHCRLADGECGECALRQKAMALEERAFGTEKIRQTIKNILINSYNYGNRGIKSSV